MIRITLINERNQRFDKVFPNDYLADQFMKKIRYSKKLTFVSRVKED